LVALAVIFVGFSLAGAERSPALTLAEFEKLHKDLHLKSQPWATIPWKVSVTEARLRAAESQKPVFLVVNTGNCLGFV